jgi:hypothetical protein
MKKSVFLNQLFECGPQRGRRAEPRASWLHGQTVRDRLDQAEAAIIALRSRGI